MVRLPKSIRFVDSHTEGEPTRVVYGLETAFGGLSAVELARCLDGELSEWRRGLLCEPRGSEAIVGAILMPPTSGGFAAEVAFFNPAGALGMCGHGAMGVVETLARRPPMWAKTNFEPSLVRLSTPVGPVICRRTSQGQIEIDNVAAYVRTLDASVTVRGKRFTGDVAYGGNWFFISKVEAGTIRMDRLQQLSSLTHEIRRALKKGGIAGDDAAEIDHIELFEPLGCAKGARVYVMCPSGEYDRSPCGTGTSAKVACLAVRGELQPDEAWRQISVTGGRFEARYRRVKGQILPTVSGRAWIVASGRLCFESSDPLRFGLNSG